MNIEDFKKIIAEEFVKNENIRKIYSIDSEKNFDELFSSLSLESIFVNLWAFGAWIVFSLFEKHKQEINTELTALKPHTLRWYVNKAKDYQHGDDLPKDTKNGQYISDKYEKEDKSKKIVRYAVAQEVAGQIQMKVAKYTSEEDKTPLMLNQEQLNGLKRYFSQVKDAGVPMAIISNEPDQMEVDATIFYNPMKMSEKDGKLVDSEGVEVVKNTIEKAIENLPFNGDCRVSDVLEAIKNIEGIDVAHVTEIRTKGVSGTLKTVIGYTTPDSGYFKLTALNLKLAPYNYGNEL